MLNTIKTSIYAAGAAICGYFGVVEYLMIALAVAVLFDFVLGVAKSYVLGHHITSQQGTVGIIKKATILCIPFLLGLLGISQGYNLEWIISACMGLLIVCEVFSSMGHVVAIYTGKSIKEIDATTMVIKRLYGLIEKILLYLINKKGDDLIKTLTNDQTKK